MKAKVLLPAELRPRLLPLPTAAPASRKEKTVQPAAVIRTVSAPSLWNRVAKSQQRCRRQAKRSSASLTKNSSSLVFNIFQDVSSFNLKMLFFLKKATSLHVASNHVLKINLRKTFLLNALYLVLSSPCCCSSVTLTLWAVPCRVFKTSKARGSHPEGAEVKVVASGGRAWELNQIVKRVETTETVQVRAIHLQLVLLWVSGTFF